VWLAGITSEATMTSILTNHSAMSALQTLRSVGSTLTDMQEQVSSGLRVKNAADNAAYWSISTSMKSDAKALSAVSDAIGTTNAILDTTYAGLDAIHQELDTIKSLMVTAASMPTPDISYFYNAYDNWREMDPAYAQSEQAKVALDVDQHMQQIRSILRGSSFAGTNLLYMGDNSPVEARNVTNTFVTGYANGRALTVDLPLTDTLLVNDSYMDAATFSNSDPGNGGLLDPSMSLTVEGSDGITHSTGIAMFTNWSITWQGAETEPLASSNDMIRKVEFYTQKYGADRQDAWNQVIQQWDERLGKITALMGKIGSIQQDMQRTDTSVMQQRTSIDEGVSRLIDADMEEASAKLAAQQTQQQLAVQSLQIANQAPQNIMQLFQ